MFALRQIDRQPVVRPAANENCPWSGKGGALALSSPHFFPLAFFPFSPLFPPWPVSSRPGQGLLTPAHTLAHTLFSGLPETVLPLPFPDWAGLLPRSRCRLPLVPSPPAALAFKSGRSQPTKPVQYLEPKLPAGEEGHDKTGPPHISKQSRVIYRKHVKVRGRGGGVNTQDSFGFGAFSVEGRCDDCPAPSQCDNIFTDAEVPLPQGGKRRGETCLGSLNVSPFDPVKTSQTWLPGLLRSQPELGMRGRDNRSCVPGVPPDPGTVRSLETPSDARAGGATRAGPPPPPSLHSSPRV